MGYDALFFKENLKSSIRSARVCVPIILNFVAPKSVLDVGCGVGSWLKIFKENGIQEVLGVDGSWAKQFLQIPLSDFLECDLSKPINLERKFDLVVSLETAEHLPSERADSFVQSLTDLGRVIVFSAAIPKQGGTHHLNEQWPDYWANLFQKRGYEVVDCLRKYIWRNENVDSWYSQNMLIFVAKEELDKLPLLKEEKAKTFGDQLSIVHPNLYLLHSNPKTIGARTVLKALLYLPRRAISSAVREIKRHLSL